MVSQIKLFHQHVLFKNMSIQYTQNYRITKMLPNSVGQFFHPWFQFCEVGRESRHHVHVSTTQSVQ